MFYTVYWTLTALYGLLILITFPFSLLVIIKVRVIHDLLVSPVVDQLYSACGKYVCERFCGFQI